MNVNQIAETLKARIITGGENSGIEAEMAFASDLMSDVLTLKAENVILITGLANLQTVRTAEMSDIRLVILARNKKASPEMIELAAESGIVLMECSYSMFKTCGILFANGIKPVY